MSFYSTHLREMIRSVLMEFEPKFYSPGVEELLVGTAAVESDFGRFLKQLPNGPGQGIFSIEPATERSVWLDYLEYRDHLKERVKEVTGVHGPGTAALSRRLDYQIIIARLKYRMCPGPIPEPEDVTGLARYWNKYYNANPIKGTDEDFISKYKWYGG